MDGPAFERLTEYEIWVMDTDVKAKDFFDLRSKTLDARLSAAIPGSVDLEIYDRHVDNCETCWTSPEGVCDRGFRLRDTVMCSWEITSETADLN